MQQMQSAFQLRHIADLSGKTHGRRAVLGLRAHCDDIDFLAQEHVGNVALQSVPVIGIEHNINGKDIAGLVAPRRIDHPLGMHRFHVGKI